ncbi:hypothetical protein ILYODFUR_030639 [Ilyodon furcidens]|uniref:Uncharacterized protein n=1 Tax=Ilyodon furcidens TaxID=33524 RepID=A0ABV0ULR6_9TELE
MTLSLSKSVKQSNEQKSHTSIYTKNESVISTSKSLCFMALDPPRVRGNKVIYEGTHLPSLEAYTSGSVNHKPSDNGFRVHLLLSTKTQRSEETGKLKVIALLKTLEH